MFKGYVKSILVRIRKEWIKCDTYSFTLILVLHGKDVISFSYSFEVQNDCVCIYVRATGVPRKNGFIIHFLICTVSEWMDSLVCIRLIFLDNLTL
jgi:hypothetical protein